MLCDSAGLAYQLKLMVLTNDLFSLRFFLAYQYVQTCKRMQAIHAKIVQECADPGEAYRKYVDSIFLSVC